MIRSKKLLDAARDQSCVNCGVRDGTVVAAHYTDLEQLVRERDWTQAPRPVRC